jgi:HEAT repeats
MACRLMVSVSALALGLSACMVGCASDPPAAPTTVAATAPVGSPTYQEDQAGAARYPGRSDVYFSTYVVAEDDPEPASPYFGMMANAGKKIRDGFGNFGHLVAVEFRWYVRGDRPIKAVEMMNDPNSADARRTGINELLTYNFAKGPPYTVRYRQISAFDDDATVRAVALRASNRSRDVQATPLFVSALSDKSELVRLEGAKALVHLPDPAAERSLMRELADPNENLDVRIAAADALKHYHDLTNARALAEALDDKDFSIVWQARRSLVYLTGRDFGYDDGAWLNFFAGPDKPFG